MGRDLSYPDINSLAKLAECLGVSVDQLMQCQHEVNRENTIKKLTNTILKAIPVAMGVSVVVLILFNEIDVQDALTMLEIGLACVEILLLNNEG